MKIIHPKIDKRTQFSLWFILAMIILIQIPHFIPEEYKYLTLPIILLGWLILRLIFTKVFPKKVREWDELERLRIYKSSSHAGLIVIIWGCIAATYHNTVTPFLHEIESESLIGIALISYVFLFLIFNNSYYVRHPEKLK